MAPMVMRWILSCGLLAASHHAFVQGNDGLRPAFNTTSGMFAPYIADSHPDVASFLDIPYAENPTGALRFAPPVAAKPRTANGSVVLAKNLPNGCFQYISTFLQDTIIPDVVTEFLLQKRDHANTTEDCLHLTIYAPKAAVEQAAIGRRSPRQPARDVGYNPKREQKPALPVVVWIHGGGYGFGGNNVPFQLASDWVQRSQEHIVVQVQYRLNFLGFPNAAGMASDEAASQGLNLALLDQRLAVEWVRDNIASVGGDPSRITLWGHSAGGYSVDAYPFAWQSDPIVIGVIANSANAVGLGQSATDSSNHTVFSTAASRLGCGNTSSPAEELACMRAVPSADLKAFIQDGGALADGLAFFPVVDNVTVFSNYTDLLISGRHAHIPLLTGTLTDEGSAVVPADFEGSETATELPPALAPAAQGYKLTTQCTTLQEVRARAESNLTTYQYYYAGNFSNISPRPWLGAYHSSELPLIFGTYDLRGTGSELEHSTSLTMQDRFSAFVKDPVNGLKNGGWLPSTGSAGSPMMEWAADGIVEQSTDIDGLREECVSNGYTV
ncbi:Uu.00g007660.m01.CDS01 [Anthostomella pinea]|uniref:Uu.00g007660.m01.CDS01 n=1 Tax=Anthostomella pinea TaxID=933095 RepID=A0AAI8YMF7_9PEZI|nr:Uu.00g007660.m01.CDS01 [Anthostomella pinea]